MKQPKNYYFKRIILFLNMLVITCSVILTRSFIDVYADDYEYIPINDLEQYNAYRYFSLYGYKLDYTNTVSYNISESGTFSASYYGTFNSGINGSESTTVNFNISNYTGAGALQNEITYGGIIVMSPQSVTGNTIDISLEADQTNNPTSSAPFVCRATGYSPGTDDWEYNEFTCSTTGGAGYQVFPDYNLVVDAFNISNNGVGTLTIDLQSNGSTVGSFSGNLNGSNSGSLNGSISLSGTESTTGHKLYDIPVMNADNINNTYLYGKQIYARNNNPYVISFLSSTSGNATDRMPVAYNSDGTLNTDIIITRKNLVLSHSGYYLSCYEISGKNDNTLIYLQWPYKHTDLIPIYVGMLNNMSDKLYRYLYGSDRTNELIDQGTNQSQTAGQNLNNQTNNFTDASDDLHNFEIDMKENMNDALEDIDVDNAFNFWSTSGPLKSMNWVKLQFNKLIQYDPIKKTLIFSLTLGLALTILGKLRNK